MNGPTIRSLVSTALAFVACILVALSTDHDLARAMAIAIAALAVLVAVRTVLRGLRSAGAPSCGSRRGPSAPPTTTAATAESAATIGS